MHQSPQKQLGGRREKYVAAAFALADDDGPQRPQHRTSQGKARKMQWREDAPRDRAGSRHPRG
ncbi:MAG: hypothetical protein EOO24_10985 [Comamonadaceae bacterium]|nr:MAG: hypothetical protein EOO24_10985 [Comamonadaceae bacterium]